MEVGLTIERAEIDSDGLGWGGGGAQTETINF